MREMEFYCSTIFSFKKEYISIYIEIIISDKSITVYFNKEISLWKRLVLFFLLCVTADISKISNKLYARLRNICLTCCT